MVVGYHLIWTAYGWWLPNDPRGSSSQEIRVERIAELGELHQGRKTIQPYPAEIRRFYEQARISLKHNLMTVGNDEFLLLGACFAGVIRDCKYTCYACAIMPDHVHMLIRKHRDKAEVMIENLQHASRQAMIKAGRRPVNHPVWGGSGWKVFLNTREDMERIVRYVRDNPIKAGLPLQVWSFVIPYNGWMPREWWGDRSRET
jgi:REP element-mobilizing transposase RayT